MTKDGFPDRAGSIGHTTRLRVRDVLTENWQSIDDLQSGIKSLWPENDSPTKGEIGKALAILKKWGYAVCKPKAGRSRQKTNKNGSPRKTIGWKLGS